MSNLEVGTNQNKTEIFIASDDLIIFSHCFSKTKMQGIVLNLQNSKWLLNALRKNIKILENQNSEEIEI